MKKMYISTKDQLLPIYVGFGKRLSNWCSRKARERTKQARGGQFMKQQWREGYDKAWRKMNGQEGAVEEKARIAVWGRAELERQSGRE